MFPTKEELGKRLRQRRRRCHTVAWLSLCTMIGCASFLLGKETFVQAFLAQKADASTWIATGMCIALSIMVTACMSSLSVPVSPPEEY